MVLFYVVSDMGILHAINARESYYKNEDAILVSRYVSGSSGTLLDHVRTSGIFKRVLPILFPDPMPKGGLLGKSRAVRAFHKHNHYRRIINTYMDKHEMQLQVDKLIVMHMDSFAIYVADYFLKFDPDMQIEFVEDGTASYLCTRKYLTSPIRWGMSTAKYLAKAVPEWPMRRRLRPHLTQRLYLNFPQQYPKEMGFEDVKGMTAQKTCLSLMEKNGAAVDRDLVNIYNEKHIYFIANPISFSEHSYDEAYSYIDTILQSVGAKSLLIKTHSNASTSNKLQYAAQYEEEVFVDRNVNQFESLLTQVEELEKKIIVSRASSTLLNVKALLEKEPYLILTFRMYNWYWEMGDEGGDTYLDILKKVYTHPERIMAPTNRYELGQCILKAYTDIYGREALNDMNRPEEQPEKDRVSPEAMDALVRQLTQAMARYMAEGAQPESEEKQDA